MVLCQDALVKSATAPAAREYTVDELAREANTTVRNVRAYQDRGLLAPPERRGRAGVYNGAHVARLQLVNTLLAKGYTLGNIQALLQAVEKGYDVREMLALEQAIAGAATPDASEAFEAETLAAMFQVSEAPNALARAQAMGLLAHDGKGYRSPNPELLRVGAELVRAGVALDDVLTLGEGLRVQVDRAAAEMVKLLVTAIDRYRGQLPPREAVPQLAALVRNLRPLALRAVEAEVSRALSVNANRFLGERVAEIMANQAVQEPALSVAKPSGKASAPKRAKKTR